MELLGLMITGQRYHVILNANPINESVDGNYWIRTIPSKGCGDTNFQVGNPPANETGIIRYHPTSLVNPTTNQTSFSIECSDEPYENLKPMFKLNVTDPVNIEGKPAFAKFVRKIVS